MSIMCLCICVFLHVTYLSWLDTFEVLAQKKTFQVAQKEPFHIPRLLLTSNSTPEMS